MGVLHFSYPFVCIVARVCVAHLRLHPGTTKADIAILS